MKARLVETREIAPEIRHFIFEVPEAPQFLFIPGQWVSVEERVDGEPITRAYSIASPPDGNRFELCLNRVQYGHLSPYLFTLHPGDEIEMRGPFGTFILREPPNDSVLVATGTGIAPFRAMLPARLAKDAAHQMTLLFGVRHEGSLLYRAEFESLEHRHPNFHFWPTLTRPEPAWSGRTGRVQQHLTAAIESQSDCDVYICGLRAMVDETRAMLKGLGFERKRIIYEKYD
ncbi:MAG: oxidoreductase [Acidobacteriia bacterium]|nr:oxidoreductase [Terriglobia bacterium]